MKKLYQQQTECSTPHMNNQVKFIRDPIHGNIKFTDIYTELLETPELQRLYHVKQLGFAHLVFPGAHHTRLEHSFGAYKIAHDVAATLELDREQTTIICCAALLHDIGHGPFSHTLESILLQEFGVDHVDLTDKLLLGDYDVFTESECPFIHSSSVHEVLTNHGVNIQELADVVKGKTYTTPYLSQVLHSAIDVDQLDYLIRDAYYTGVAYGIIDLQRLLQTITIHNTKLAIDRKGVSVVENILMARGLMYSSVYFHKTVRIAELMLSKAFELLIEPDPFRFFSMTDAELINDMKTMGSYQQEIATRLKYRSLFKQAYVLPVTEVSEDHVASLKTLEEGHERRKKERELEDLLNIPEGHVIIDMPFMEIQRTEPRIYKTDIDVVDHDTVKSLDEFTPVAEAIRSRATPDWIIMVATDKKYKQEVAAHAYKILFG